jgi:hypothetical protein
VNTMSMAGMAASVTALVEAVSMAAAVDFTGVVASMVAVADFTEEADVGERNELYSLKTKALTRPKASRGLVYFWTRARLIARYRRLPP